MRKWLGCAAALAVVVTAACGRSSRHEGASSAGSPGKGGNGAGGSGVGGASGKGGFGGAANAGRGGASGGTGGSADCSVDPAEIDGLSFLVHFRDADGLRCCEGVPGPTTFHFEQAASDLELVVGSEGQAFRGVVTPDGERLSVEAGLRVRDDGNPGAGSVNNGAIIETLSLCFHPPRDSSPSLDGAGLLRLVRNGDDYVDEVEVEVAFTDAREDDAPPTLRAEQTINPLDQAEIPVSEPLELGALAALDDPGQTPLSPVEQAGTIVAFRVSRILPLGFEARIGTDARDLQGNRLIPESVVRTDSDPGVQALDGFESELRVVDYGSYSARLVTGSRAIEGLQSLEVPGGSTALLHLARSSSNANHVRFDLRLEPRLVMVPASVVVRAGVVGGSEIVTHEIPIVPSDDGLSGGGGEGGSGPVPGSVMTVDLELSETGDDILLEISAPFIELSASTDVGAVIDGLRID